jgi:exonuclease SbcC
MKKRVLQLLDFKEPPNPRSHSVIYRYAIFTPQEAMKAVLGQKPSDRKQTLRKAFGIEEYNTASENSTHLESEIEIDMRVLKKSEEEISGIVFKIEEETSQITDLEKNIEINNENIIKLEETQKEVNKLVLAKQEKVQKYRGIKSQIEIQKNQKALQEPMLEEAKERLLEINLNLKKCEEAKKKSKKLFSKYKELIENRIKRRKLEPEKEAYDQAIRQIELEEQIIETEGKNIQEKLENLQDNKENLKKQIQSFQLELQSLSELEDEVTQLESVVQGLPRFRDTLSDITSQISSQMQYIQNLQTKRDDLAREWRQIEKIGIGAECPRCQQQLTPMHYKLLEKKLVQDVNNVEKEIKKLNSKKKEAAKELENISNKIKVFEDKQKKFRV